MRRNQDRDRPGQGQGQTRTGIKHATEERRESEEQWDLGVWGSKGWSGGTLAFGGGGEGTQCGAQGADPSLP